LQDFDLPVRYYCQDNFIVLLKWAEHMDTFDIINRARLAGDSVL
jgi:hypothetical protein